MGLDFWEIGGITECESCCKVMVEASKPHSLHPTSIYHIYTMCFSTLICCGWTCRCTLTLIFLWRWWVWIFGKLGVLLSVSHVVKSWLRLQSPVDYIPHPYHIYTMYFSTLICCGWTCGCLLTLIRLWWWWLIFRKIGGITEYESCCKVMVEAPKPRRLHPTSISSIYKGF